MATLFYVQLIGLTLGTIVYLFLIALILGHRRPRLFERVFFFLILSSFLIYAGVLLEVNSRIEYGAPPAATAFLYRTLIALGVLFLPALLVHAHVLYLRLIQPDATQRSYMAITYAFYGVAALDAAADFVVAKGNWRLAPQALLDWSKHPAAILMAAIVATAIIQIRIIRALPAGPTRRLFQALWATVAAAFVLVSVWLGLATSTALRAEGILTALLVTGTVPGALLIYQSLRHNFLEFGAQRNLVYALSATFLALLYLAMVRRVSGWLEPVLPPEATAAILLFILVFLFEPLERAIGPALHRRFREGVERLQRLTIQLQENARRGSVAELIGIAERSIREEFGLAAVLISVPRDESREPLQAPGGLGHVVEIPLLKDGQEMGLLEAASTGSYLTGETTAALEFLAEQLPGMIDLCRLLEEKLRLERELAERERLALLGQMAASVSHNLRNPLSSMKTILQVQLEKPGLPFDLRHDCALVVGEIDRMSAKLTQLLKFSKPSVNGRRIAAVALAKQTAALFSRDAERRNVRLEFDCPAHEILILASEEALSETLTNLIVNAIETQPNGGRVRVALVQLEGQLEIRIEDDGPGISPQIRSKIFQPFFTTKATGTGLGLAIVARRIADMGGHISFESPISNGKGARFTVDLPILAEGKESHADDSDRR